MVMFTRGCSLVLLASLRCPTEAVQTADSCSVSWPNSSVLPGAATTGTQVIWADRTTKEDNNINNHKTRSQKWFKQRKNHQIHASAMACQNLYGGSPLNPSQDDRRTIKVWMVLHWNKTTKHQNRGIFEDANISGIPIWKLPKFSLKFWKILYHNFVQILEDIGGYHWFETDNDKQIDFQPDFGKRPSSPSPGKERNQGRSTCRSGPGANLQLYVCMYVCMSACIDR